MADDRCELLCLDLPRAELIRRGLNERVIAEGAARAKALSNPTRLTIALALWDGGELCVCDLGWITARAENLVSHHVRALRAAGLAAARRDGKVVFYSLSEAGRALVGAHLGTARAAP